ncbi:MAG TPA: hypothetical protein VGD81_06175 [Opitutaceae bacterium]
MSEHAPSSATPSGTPAKPRLSLYQRVTKSAPLLVTVIVHVVLFLVAGAWVVQEQIIGKKTKFEAPPPSDATPMKQVEHRLQVARKGGSSGGSSSPISANRIYSTAEGALQLPEMPDLPSMGAGGFGGFGGMGAGLGLGSGTSMNTSLGGGGLGGRGFMSLTFLGMTSQNVNKVVFVIEAGAYTMDVRKGGFEAFNIMREEIMKLVGALPPNAQFNVVLFDASKTDGGAYNLFSRTLTPAVVSSKDEFFAWMQPINLDYQRIGVFSAAKATPWVEKKLSEQEVDPRLVVPIWTRALQAALEMQPDTVYVITATVGEVRKRRSEQEIAKDHESVRRKREELAKKGVDIKAIEAAKRSAYAKARRELDAINKKQLAKGKPPFVVPNESRIFQADFQEALRKAGYSITLDRTGWTNDEGKELDRGGSVRTLDPAEFKEVYTHISRLQKALLPQSAKVNLFYFSGPDQDGKKIEEVLSPVARRNGGRFEFVTTKRLQEIKAQAEAQAK